MIDGEWESITERFSNYTTVTLCGLAGGGKANCERSKSMSEYIKREDAIKAILNITMSKGHVPVDTVTHCISDLPSADVVEVVRCKDCKYRPYIVDPNKPAEGFNLEQEWGLQRCPYLVADGWYSIMPDDDWFCSRGERKGGDDNE